MPLFGAHMSVAGGVALSLDRMEAAGGECLQIFTKNQRRWDAPQLNADDVESFRAKRKALGIVPVASHASYLVNLATADPTLREKSIANLADELLRCAAYGVEYVVVHPGAHGGDGASAAMPRAAGAIDAAFERSGVSDARLLLENTAGQGSWLGAAFSELGGIIGASENSSRLGVCFDTAHAFAAGYDLRGEEGYGAAFAELEREVGLERLLWFHLNDSLGGLGSHKDRHTHIGEGELGISAFRLLVNDPRFATRPMALETPKEDDLDEDRKNLATLRGLVEKGRVRRR